METNNSADVIRKYEELCRSYRECHNNISGLYHLLVILKQYEKIVES